MWNVGLDMRTSIFEPVEWPWWQPPMISALDGWNGGDHTQNNPGLPLF